MTIGQFGLLRIFFHTASLQPFSVEFIIPLFWFPSFLVDNALATDIFDFFYCLLSSTTKDEYKYWDFLYQKDGWFFNFNSIGIYISRKLSELEKILPWKAFPCFDNRI